MSIVERFLGRKKTPQPENRLKKTTYYFAEQEPDEKPLSPLLQKNKEIVEQFAKKHDLKLVIWDGSFSLKKKINDDFPPEEVVGINNYNKEEIISINVYQSGPDGYLSKAIDDLLKPINKDGKGDDVELINRDVKEDLSIGGILVRDTTKAKAKLKS